MSSGRKARQSAFRFRNALNDFDATPSDLVAQGSDPREPVVTIGIPTFKRPDLLAESVASSLAQDFDRPYEIVVVDNDPASDGAAALLERLPELARGNFRYFVNRDNIGMLPNWNRCIQLARGQWVTVLNDDDLLDQDCLTTIFAELDRDPGIDGIAVGKRSLDQRVEKPPSPGAAQRTAARARAVAKRGLLAALFRGKQSRRFDPGKFFWGPLMGNVGGFVFRKASAEAVGGFYPEEYPSADYWFYARFAQRCHLRQHRAIGSTTRVAVNESAKAATLKGFMLRTYELHQTLAAGDVPRWWGRFSPHLIAYHRVELREIWGIEIPQREVEEMLGVRLPRPRPNMLWAARLALGGF